MRSTDDWLVTDELAKLPTQLVYKLLQIYITKLAQREWGAWNLNHTIYTQFN